MWHSISFSADGEQYNARLDWVPAVLPTSIRQGVAAQQQQSMTCVKNALEEKETSPFENDNNVFIIIDDDDTMSATTYESLLIYTQKRNHRHD